jgi:signal transduction histidine kinase/CheY-like chemotaxis protein
VSQRFDAGATPLRGAVLSIAEDGDGNLFVGSNRVLAVFDGGRWQTVDMPESAYAFRGLAAARLPAGPEGGARPAPRIYVGAIGAIGYLERAPDGAWRFTSLRGELEAAGVPDPGDIWQAFAVDGGAVFVTSDKVLAWRAEGRFDVWSLPNPAHLLAYGGREPLPASGSAREPPVWIYQEGVGLLRLGASGAPVLVAAERDLPEHPVTWMALPWIGLGDGAYRWDGAGGFTRMEGLSAALRGRLPAMAVRLDERTVAIGTFRRGLVIASGDRAGAEARTRGIDGDHGLGGENVYALHGTSEHLWAGLENGLVRLDQVDGTRLIDGRDGLDRGDPLKVISGPSGTDVLTAHGVYEDPGGLPGAAAPEFRPVLAHEALLRDMVSVDGGLWVGGFGGIWLRAPTAAAAEPAPAHVYDVWADVLQMTSSRKLPGALVFIEGYSMKALWDSPGTGGWGAHDLGERLDDMPVSLLEGPDGDLWAGTMTTGVYRFGWRETGEGPALFRKAHYTPGSGFPEGARNARLTLLGGRPVAFVEMGGGQARGAVLQLRDDGLSGGFFPMRGLEGFTGIAAARRGDDAYWVVQRAPLEMSAVIKVSQDTSASDASWEPVDVAGLDEIGQVTGASLTPNPRGPGTLWIGGEKGLLRFDTAPAGIRRPPPPPQLAIRSALKDRRPGSFAFPSPSALADPEISYETRLRGAESGWSLPSRLSEREFPVLSPGGYTFEARAVDRWGRTGPAAALSFVVPAPWWETWPAFAGYGTALALGVAGAVRQRTRKRLAALNRRNEELDALVTERTRELAERSRELEMSNSAKSDFLASISHEIRNPLNGITGLVAMLNDAALEGRERELARSLAACAHSLNQVFEEVLGFSRLEFGPVAVRTRAFDLDRIIDEVTGVFRAQADQRGCRLVVAPAGPPGRDVRAAETLFLGDDEKIRTILANFVANAIKYAPGGPVEISAEIDEDARAAEHDVVFVTVSVADNGPGVPPEEQELIFRKFVRGAQAKEKGLPGAGLGLASCKALAELIGGSVGIESDPKAGPGSVFYLRVPLARTTRETVEDGWNENGARSFPAFSIDDARLKTRRVLVVDDQDYNRMVAERIVRRLGFEPAAASGAEEALAMLGDGDFDVVLLDWELPDGKGGEVARAIRAGRTSPAGAATGEPAGARGTSPAPPGREARPPGRPIILATTAHDSEDVRAACRRAGMDGFVLKPLDEASLGAMIEASFAQRGWQEGGRPVDREGGSEVDLSVFGYVAGEDPAQAARAAAEFGIVLDREVASLKTALGSEDLSELERASHRLRSHAGLVHCASLNETTRTLENRARTATLEERTALVREIASQAAGLKSRIAAYPSTP